MSFSYIFHNLWTLKMPLWHKVSSKAAYIQINDPSSYWCMGSFIHIASVAFIVTGDIKRLEKESS